MSMLLGQRPLGGINSSTGAIALGTLSTLDVTIASGLNFTMGTTYVLLNGTSLTGAFSGITDGQMVTFNGYEFTADYTPPVSILSLCPNHRHGSVARWR